MDVAQRAGRRIIVQGEPEIDEPSVLGIGAVPHHWLFPQMAAVVHHAGAGTAAAGLLAGVPAVPVPIFTDQPFWAQRIHQLDAAAQPIAYKQLVGGGRRRNICGLFFGRTAEYGKDAEKIQRKPD